MKILNYILVILCLLIALFLGVKDLFVPNEMAPLYGLELKEVLAINTFRAVISGTILSMALMLLLGLFTKNKTWYQATLLVTTVILVFRTFSIIVDGYTSEMLAPIVIEIFIIVAMLLGIKHLNASKK
jgi:hypothetical protein